MADEAAFPTPRQRELVLAITRFSESVLVVGKAAAMNALSIWHQSLAPRDHWEIIKFTGRLSSLSEDDAVAVMADILGEPYTNHPDSLRSLVAAIRDF